MGHCRLFPTRLAFFMHHGWAEHGLWPGDQSADETGRRTIITIPGISITNSRRKPDNKADDEMIAGLTGLPMPRSYRDEKSLKLFQGDVTDFLSRSLYGTFLSQLCDLDDLYNIF